MGVVQEEDGSALSRLAQFREGAAPPKPRVVKDAYRFLGTVLVFDQTISKTGWAFGISREDGFEVKATGVFLTDAIATGHEDNLRRAVRCYRQYHSLIRSFVPDMVVHEMPPISNAYVRGDSSLVAAVAVRLAHDETFPTIPLRMISAQHAKKVLTGNAKASKAEVKAEVIQRAVGLTLMKKVTQDVTDAIALALVAIEEAP